MQFLADRIDWKGKTFEILGAEARHIAQVLRKKPGDVVRLFDGKGAICWGEIAEASPGRVRGRLMENQPENNGFSKPPVKIHLFQAIPKGERWDWVLQKGSELGVASFHPVLSSRTVVKISKTEAPKKLTRWKKILEAACKQCGLPGIPEIQTPVSFQEALQKIKGDSSGNSLSLFCWESELAEPLPRVLQRLLPSASPLLEIFLFVGPEGGWSVEEAEAAKKAGCIPVGLGPHVLRAETAPIVAVSMIQAVLMIGWDDR